MHQMHFLILMSACSAGQLAREGMPAIDVRVGTVTASSAAATAAAANAPNAPNYPHVSLLWCDLACLPAGRQQQLTLHLQLPATGGAAAAATACGLLCFNSGGVLLDEDAGESRLGHCLASTTCCTVTCVAGRIAYHKSETCSGVG
jgi:hypothetical protein